jgi:hypothetical protein
MHAGPPSGIEITTLMASASHSGERGRITLIFESDPSGSYCKGKFHLAGIGKFSHSRMLQVIT